MGRGRLEAAGSQGAGRARAVGGAGGDAGRGDAGARWGRGGAEGGPSGSPPPAPPRPRPARSDRGRPGGRRAGRFPVLGVARLSRGRAARAAGAPGRPWPPPAPRAPPCCSPSATPCSCPSTRYPRRPRWHCALAAPSAAVCHPRGSRDPGPGARAGAGAKGGGDPLVIVRSLPGARYPPAPSCPPSPHPPGQPAGAPGTDVRACMLGPAPCHSSARPGACVHRVVGDRSPEAASSACGHGCRQCVERLCFGGAGVSVPCARGTGTPRGKDGRA